MEQNLIHTKAYLHAGLTDRIMNDCCKAETREREREPKSHDTCLLLDLLLPILIYEKSQQHQPHTSDLILKIDKPSAKYLSSNHRTRCNNITTAFQFLAYFDEYHPF